MIEALDRKRVVEIARSWIGTPYLSNAAIRGAGVDCAMLLVEVYKSAGLIEKDFDPRPYPPEWHLHTSEEKYRNFVAKFGREIEGPTLPGDVVLFRVGRTFAHGGIVIDWPTIIHARAPTPVFEEDISLDSFGKHALWRLPRLFYSMW